MWYEEVDGCMSWGTIDPVLPHLIDKHNYSYSDVGVDGVGVQGGDRCHVFKGGSGYGVPDH